MKSYFLSKLLLILITEITVFFNFRKTMHFKYILTEEWLEKNPSLFIKNCNDG